MEKVEMLIRNNTKRDLARSLVMEEGLSDRYRHIAEEARADEKQAMAYLQQCREAVGHSGDFPSLVERLRNMAEARGDA